MDDDRIAWIVLFSIFCLVIGGIYAAYYSPKIFRPSWRVEVYINPTMTQRVYLDENNRLLWEKFLEFQVGRDSVKPLSLYLYNPLNYNFSIIIDWFIWSEHSNVVPLYFKHFSSINNAESNNVTLIAAAPPINLYLSCWFDDSLPDGERKHLPTTQVFTVFKEVEA